ncbi:MAG: hypothetical protein ACI3YH_05585 [Eubacteriales bacterium]
MKTVSKHSLAICGLLVGALLLSSCGTVTAATTAPTPSVTTTPVTTAATVTTVVPVTTAAPDEPVTEPSTPTLPDVDEDEKVCLQRFTEGLAAAGKPITLSRALTADELASLGASFAGDEELRMVLACARETFYRPEDISLYELLYASDIRKEFPDNPFGNDGSMMTAARIEAVVKQYLGIDITDAMWNRLVIDGAEYFSDSDAYGFAHTDASGFYPESVSFGYETADGKLLLHLTEAGTGAHLTVLLTPTDGGYLVDAGQAAN